jgi:hypothetical protein
MALSKDLFLAILSMDTYNRGYSAGINFGAGSDALGVRIGNASILKNAADPQGVAQSAGFYAIAYDTSGVSGFSSGEKTIAYRGTDQLFPSLSIGGDIWNAYGVASAIFVRPQPRPMIGKRCRMDDSSFKRRMLVLRFPPRERTLI